MFCWKHYKDCVFSRTQLLCITDSKSPLSRRGNPYFCSVWWFVWLQKSIFPKHIVATKMRVFYLPNTSGVCLFFQKCHFCKTKLLLHNHPRTLFFSFFWNCPFPCFHLFSFSFFPTYKRQKTRSAHFFRIPLSDTLTNCKNKSHPYTLFVIF